MLRSKHLENHWLQSQYKYGLHTDAQETMHLKNENGAQGAINFQHNKNFSYKTQEC